MWEQVMDARGDATSLWSEIGDAVVDAQGRYVVASGRNFGTDKITITCRDAKLAPVWKNEELRSTSTTFASHRPWTGATAGSSSSRGASPPRPTAPSVSGTMGASSRSSGPIARFG